MTVQTHRRNLLKAALYGSAAVALNPLNSKTALAGTGLNADYTELARKQNIIKLASTHTGEELNVLYKDHGQYVPHNLDRLNHLLRDHREDEARVMDPRLFDQLSAIQSKLGTEETFEIISGYRSPKTNSMLRKTSSGVAKQSYHMLGQAMDIRLRNVSLSDLHYAAIELNAGGVGLYSSSDFVHIDTGPVRNWGS